VVSVLATTLTMILSVLSNATGVTSNRVQVPLVAASREVAVTVITLLVSRVVVVPSTATFLTMYLMVVTVVGPVVPSTQA